MGAPKPWPTRWPEPGSDPRRIWDEPGPPSDPQIDPGPGPGDDPYDLPEDVTNVPLSFTWGITDPCNLRCIHCYDATSRQRTELSTADALECLHRLSRAGVRFIAFSGGEPLLRKDLFRLLEECRALGIRTGLRSNGTLIGAEAAGRLCGAGLVVAGISIDGARSETHDAVRGPGTFLRTMRGVHALVGAGIRVNLEFVLSTHNAAEAIDAIGLAEGLGVSEINFAAVAPVGRGRTLTDHWLTNERWRELTATLRSASKRAAVCVSPSCSLTGTCVSCLEPNLTCEGWVTPCYLSEIRLFHLLDIAPEELPRRLQALRPTHQDVCGRMSWTTSSSLAGSLFQIAATNH